MPEIRSSSILFVLTLLRATAALVPADPTITEAARLPKRQNDADFIGWLSSDNTWYSETCDTGLTWYQDSNYAQCCPASVATCNHATACMSGTLIYTFPALFTTSKIACTDNYGTASFSICNTVFIFENENDSDPKTDIVCGASSKNWSYYRQLPASATDTVTSDTALFPSGGSGTTKKKKKGSKAWIAGAVIGPLLGLALICLVVLLLLRHRKNKNKMNNNNNNNNNNIAPVAPQAGGATMNQVHSPPPAATGPTGYNQGNPQFNPQTQPYDQTNFQNANTQQGAYPTQQGYTSVPTSPVPQYNTVQQPYSPPVSPIPQQGYYAQPDTKHAYNYTPQGGAAEVEGSAHGIVPPAAPTPAAAELGGHAPPQSASGQVVNELPASRQ